MTNVLNENIILEQKINYYILECNYNNEKIALTESSVFEKIKNVFVDKMKSFLKILTAIRDFIKKLFTKIIPETYKYIKMNIEDKLKDKNKVYKTIDIHQIETNINELRGIIMVHTDFSVFLFSSEQDFSYSSIASSYYYTSIDALKEKIAFFSDYNRVREEECEKYVKLSDIDTIKISYKEIHDLFSGRESLAKNYSEKSMDSIIKHVQEIVQTVKKLKDNPPESNGYSEDEKKEYAKRIAEVYKLYTQQLQTTISFLNSYKNDLITNINAYNKYFIKYLTKIDYTEIDEFSKRIDKYWDEVIKSLI